MFGVGVRVRVKVNIRVRVRLRARVRSPHVVHREYRAAVAGRGREAGRLRGISAADLMRRNRAMSVQKVVG